jgi:putative membrane protein
MKLILRIVLTVAGNAFALWLAAEYVSGFHTSHDYVKLAGIAFLLALLNFFVRPALKLLFGPIILLTLGVGILVVNAIVIYLLQYAANHLDALSGSITIETIPALIYGTLIITIVNWIVRIII